MAADRQRLVLILLQRVVDNHNPFHRYRQDSHDVCRSADLHRYKCRQSRRIRRWSIEDLNEIYLECYVYLYHGFRLIVAELIQYRCIILNFVFFVSLLYNEPHINR